MQGRTFDTVFIGGGTPTVLECGRISTLLSELRSCFSIADNAEITVEANPESADMDKLSEMKNAGVTRLSIGLQSDDDIVLQAIGRIHNKAMFDEAFNNARKIGFDNINVDIMHGLPLQSQASYINTLAYVTELGAEHISSYALILEESTPLYRQINEGSVKLPDDDDVADMEDLGFDFLSNHGYFRYEISNFAAKGHVCRHNLNYWNNGEYLGLGLNAHSAMRIAGRWTRWENTSLLNEYIEEIGDGKLPVRNTKIIEQDEEMFESIMLGLRKTDGIERGLFLKSFGVDAATQYAPAIAELVLDGMLVVDDKSIYLTNKGLDFQNEVLIKIMDQKEWQA